MKEQEKTLYEFAIKENSLQLFRILHEHSYVPNTYTFLYAVFYNRLDILNYMFENNFSIDLNEIPVYIDAENKRIINGETSEYFFKYGEDKRNSCLYTAMNGSIECLELLISKEFPLHINLSCYAAEFGHLHFLKYLKKNNILFSVNTCNFASRGGNLDCLICAREHGCNWNLNTCIMAAKYGHLECLQYLHKNGCQWNASTCAGAAENGHFECLKYAHEQGCDWCEITCNNAAINGHLNCLKYIIENNCPWNGYLLKKLSKDKSNPVYLYLLKNQTNMWSNA
jgi:hypothetical protein